MPPDMRRLVVARESDIQRTLREVGSRPKGRRPLEVGYTGLQVFGNVITGDIVEHNRDWMGKRRYQNVDKMRKGDATCAATLMAVTLPIASTEVIVEAKEGSDGRKPDPIVKEAADFIYHALFENMAEAWNIWIREALLFLAYGHYSFEKVYGEIKTGQYKGAMAWREFAPRHPSTFEHFYFDKHGHFMGVQQQAFDTQTNGYEERDIPLDKMIWLTNQKEAGNPLGISIFRPAYKHWKYKDGFYAVQAIAVERQGAGVPYAQYPMGTKDDDIDAAEEMLQNIQAHEQAYMTYSEGWDVGFVDMGSAKVLDPADAIEHHDQMIPKSILAGFLNLTQGDRGSFALSSDSSGFFTYSLQQTANSLAGSLQKHIVELLDFNYPNLPAYPKISFNKVGHISLDKILDGIHKLGADGFITPTIELENHIRGLLNLPSIGIDDFETYEANEIEKEKQKTQIAVDAKVAAQPKGDKK